MDVFTLLVWAFRAQKVDSAAGRGLFDLESALLEEEEPFHRRSADGAEAVAGIGALGCRVDGGGPVRGVAPPCHPDAFVALEALDEVHRLHGPHVAALVLRHAKDGAPPAASTIPPKAFPVEVEGAGKNWGVFDGRRVYYRVVAVGKVREVHTKVVRTRGQKPQTVEVEVLKDVEVCPVVWEPEPTWVSAENLKARDWLRGMETAAAFLLSANFDTHEVSAFLPPFTAHQCPTYPLGGRKLPDSPGSKVTLRKKLVTLNGVECVRHASTKKV